MCHSQQIKPISKLEANATEFDVEKDKTKSAQIQEKSLANALFDKGVDLETIAKIMEITSKQIIKTY